MKIYAPKDHILTQKALIAAKYGNIELEQTPTFEFGKDNKTPEFLSKNPLGKVPVLETDEGCIWESNAIARYIARLDPNTHLLGSNAFENALVEQWLDFAGAEISLPMRVWIYPILGYMDNHPEATNKAKADIRKVLSILNDYLADKTFLVGERITLADIVVSLTLVYLYKLVLDLGFRKPFVNTNRWFLTCINQPHFQEVLGEVVLCSKMSVAKTSSQPEEKKKQEQPKKEKPKKEQPKKKEKKPEEDEGEDDEGTEKKAPNPMDLLPPSKFVLDDWKRFYSNHDEESSVKYFWENFENEGWSLWLSNYKYNDELDNLMRTCNLIGGMFQRLEKMIKYSFASVAILKENDDSKTFQVKGIWVIRGKEIPELMKICDDYELYDWVRLDNDKDESVRNQVNEYWKWAGNFEGKKFVQGKILK
jgi:elongation factor 1-gamma